ncbi:RNA-binding protein 23/39, partial [Lecanoromycetidae sp. Uapishka_2]
MSGLNVEELLDATASTAPPEPKRARSRDRDDRYKSDRHDRDRHRDGGRDRSRDRERDRRHRDRSRDRTKKEKDVDGDVVMGSPKRTQQIQMKPFVALEETSTEAVGVHALDPGRLTLIGTIARGEARAVMAKRESENEVPAEIAQLVGYVEFKQEESVQKAIQLTGQKLLGIPIIAQLTEAEKNRQARNPEATSSNPNQIPFHRLYVGNIHFSITESDLQNVFEPFGELEFVQLQKEEQGRSRGYGFVQFRDPNQAREALDKMNGFDLAGRPIRVGLGNDKFTPESTANLLQRFQGQEHQRNYQGSAFSGHGGRGSQAGGAGGAFDRAGGRDSEKGGGGASALDDTDVAGVNFNNYSRDALMRKLARTDDPAPDANGTDQKRPVAKPKTETKPLPVSVNQASRCVLLRNMFNPQEEEGEAWIKELEDDVRAECTEKYGKVVHIALDPNTGGDIYLKFDRVQGGENAIKGLNGRFFGGRQISAQPVVDAVYSSLFSRTSAL